MSAVKGERAAVLLDKLGERLAFERTGTRLYDAILAKVEASEAHEGGPTREEVLHFRNEEARHFLEVASALDKLGGDPTAVTPSADVTAVASSGLAQVITDPRTSLDQTIEALLVLEARRQRRVGDAHRSRSGFADEETVRGFTNALQEEQEHLTAVRRWVRSAIRREAGVEKKAA